MKRNILKHVSLAIAAVLAAVFLTSCRQPVPTTSESSATEQIVQNDSEKSSSLTVTLSHAYASEQVLGRMHHLAETYMLGNLAAVVSFTEDMKNTLTVFDAESGGVLIELTYPEQQKPIGVMQMPQGYAIALRNTVSDGEYAYSLHLYDESWNRTEERDFTASIESDVTATVMLRDGKGNFALRTADAESAIVVLDENFGRIGSVDSLGTWIHGITIGNDGEIYAYYNTGGSEAVAKINTAIWDYTRIKPEGMPANPAQIGCGYGAYEFLVQDEKGAYGVDVENEVCEKLIDWVNSDFSAAVGVNALPDGRCFLTEYDSAASTVSAWILRKKTYEELKTLEIISLATFHENRSLERAVSLFNRKRSDVRIVIENYSKYNEDDGWDSGLEKFKRDMVENKVADIICTADLPFAGFANKGLFEDLYPFMEQDAEFEENAYFMNYFASMEYGGKLLHISPDFFISTAIGKKKYLGDRQGLSFAEYAQLAESLPEGMELFPNICREEALRSFVTEQLACFIDEEKGSCRFDTPEFVQMLELCGSYPSKMEMQSQIRYPYEELAYREDAALLHTRALRTVYDLHLVQEGVFGGEEITLLGKPAVNGGSGAAFGSNTPLAMSSQSQYKEEIWDFFKFLLSQEYQDTLYLTLPVRRSSLQKQMDSALQEKEWLFPLGEETLRLGAITQEEMDTLLAYIEGVQNNSRYDSTVYNIVYEEAGMYFAGDQTAQKAAETIQSRASIYLSEQA